jgi:hypothetical protein
MITRFATLSSRLLVAFAIQFMVAACGGGGGGSDFYNPDDGNSVDTDPLTITTTGLPNAIDGVQYNAVVEAAGGTESYSWAILDDGGTGFTINGGGVIAGLAPASGSYGLTIHVKDSAGRNATTSLILTVTGTSAPAPLAITTSSLPNASSAGGDYSAILSATGGQGDYQWTLLNDGGSGLQLRPDGLLSGTAPATGEYAITVSVQDDTRTVSSTLILISATTASSLAITTTSLPTGTRNLRYAAILNATGGNGTYVWTLASSGGSGLTLTPAGVLSGVPRLLGTFGLVFRVSDGPSTSQSALTLTIEAGEEGSAEVLNIVTETLPPADQGVYAASLQAAGGTTPYTWSGGDTSTPGTGFTVDAASGSITGIANNLLPGLYGYTVTVVGDANGTDTRSYVIEVPGGDLPPVRIETENPLPDATDNLTYSVIMRAVGGGSNKTWEVLETLKDEGTLFLDGPSFDPPGGNAEAGILFWSGADVAVGNYFITIKVTSDDIDGSADVATFNLEAVPAP